MNDNVNESVSKTIQNLIEIVKQSTLQVNGEAVPVVAQVLTDAQNYVWRLQNEELIIKEGGGDTDRLDNDGV